MFIPARRHNFKNYFSAFACALPRLPWSRLACLLIVVSLSQQSLAQSVNKQRLTASYLYNFAKNIEWPNEAGMASFDIAVFSPEQTPVYNELSQLAQKATLKNHPIKVNQTNSAVGLEQYELIYIETVTSELLADIYKAVEGKPVLLVTFDFTNKQLVMINLVPAGNDRLRFEVNKSCLLYTSPSPRDRQKSRMPSSA